MKDAVVQLSITYNKDQSMFQGYKVEKSFEWIFFF